MAPGAFCPFCGAPATVVGARFCNACGRDMTGGTAPAEGGAPAAPVGAPGASVPPTASAATWPGMAAPGYPAPGYGAPVYAPPATAPVVMVQTPKSAGIAVLLELLLSGAGSLYLGRIGQGLGWLFGTIIGGGLAGAIASYVVSSSVSCGASYEYACGPDLNELVSAYIIIGALAVAWLVARIVIVANQAKAMATGQTALVYNGAGMLVAQQTPQTPPSKLAINRALMIGLGIGLAALTFALVVLTGYSSGKFFGSGLYVAGAYLLALRRLAQVSWKRTALEAGLLLLGLTLIWLLIWPGVLRYDSYNSGARLVYALIGIVVDVLVGTSVALWSAPWVALRALNTPANDRRFGLYAVIVTASILIVEALPIWLRHLEYYLPTALLALVPAGAIIIMAIIEANRLKRLVEPAT